MDGISRYDAPLIPSYSAFSAQEAAARIAAEDRTSVALTTDKRREPVLFTRNKEQVRRFPEYDEITQTKQLIEEDGNHSDVLRTETKITREPLEGNNRFQVPGQLLDFLA